MGSWNIHAYVRFTFFQVGNWDIHHGKDVQLHKSFPTAEHLTSQSDFSGSLKCCLLLQNVWQHLNAAWLDQALIGWPLKSPVTILLHRVLLYFQQRDCSASEGFSSLDKYLFRLIMLTKKKKNSCEELYSVTFLSGPAAYKKQYHRNRVWDVQLNFCKKKKKKKKKKTLKGILHR